VKKTLLASLALASLLLPAALRAAGPGSGSTIRSSSGFGSAGGDDLRVEVKDGEGVILHQGKEVWSGKAEGALTTRSTTRNGETHLQAFDGDKLLWETRESAPAGVTGSSSSRSFSSRSGGNAEVPADVQAMLDDALKDSRTAMDEAMEHQRKALEDAQRHLERATRDAKAADDRADQAAGVIEESKGPRKMNRRGTIGKEDRESGKTAGERSDRQEGGNSSDGKSATGIRVEVNNGKAEVVYNGETVWSGKVKSGAPVRALASSVNGEEHAAAFAGDEVLWENHDGAADALR
jgi:hypothetical protein